MSLSSRQAFRSTRALLVMLSLLVGGAWLGVVDAGASPTTQTTRPKTTTQKPAQKCLVGVSYKLLTPGTAGTFTVTKKRANIRKGPGLGCSIIGGVTKGTKLKAPGPRAQSLADGFVWREVTGPFGTGWIFAAFLG